MATKTYFVTLKDLHKDANPNAMDYMDVVSDMLKTFKNSLVTNYAFETDSKGVLHLHCVVKGRYVSFKTLRKRHPYSIDYREIKSIYDEMKVNNYLRKQALTPEEINQKVTTRTIQLEYPFV